MNTERTMATCGVVTPNWGHGEAEPHDLVDELQKPEMRKNAKKTLIVSA